MMKSFLESTSNPLLKIVRWIDYRLPVFSFLNHFLVKYKTPKNLSYLWSMGSLAGIVLVIMILSGITLAMHYDPNPLHAFESVERIMRDVNYGWLIRYIHMNGASMFFILVYLHMFRGLYYGSYKKPRELLWMIGIVIFLVMMATAFMGYVLPWGQMSYWGATVITNLFTAIPFVGEDILHWLLGGFSVGAPTLNRFFALHYLLPFIIVALVGLHLIALHQHGSNNPLGIDPKRPEDTIPFHPYYTVKDLFSLSVFLLFFITIIFFAPNFFGEPDNYIPANPLVTPAHIVPEWYFLPFYAILRSIPDKFWGVMAMFGSIGLLFILPWIDGAKVRSAMFRPIFRTLFWAFVLNCLVLGWVGAKPPEGYYLLLGRVSTFYYFFHFLVLLPFVSRFEKPQALPPSITVYWDTKKIKKRRTDNAS
jgi:ubiquinol-cytochrome c reductase cytochrome b subunit